MLLNLAFGSPIKYEDDDNNSNNNNNKNNSGGSDAQGVKTTSEKRREGGIKQSYQTRRTPEESTPSQKPFAQQYNTQNSPVASEEDVMHLQIRNMQNKQDLMRVYMQDIQNSIKGGAVIEKSSPRRSGDISYAPAFQHEAPPNLKQWQYEHQQQLLRQHQHDGLQGEDATGGGQRRSRLSDDREASASNFTTFGGLHQSSQSSVATSKPVLPPRGVFSENLMAPTNSGGGGGIIAAADSSGAASPRTPPQASFTGMSEIDALKFLLKPRILKVSVHAQAFTAYNVLTSIKVLPASYNTQDYFFEWKDLRTGKARGFINVQWIKYVHLEAKSRFCIVGFPEADNTVAHADGGTPLPLAPGVVGLAHDSAPPSPGGSGFKYVYIHVECPTPQSSEKYVRALTFLTQQQKDETIMQMHQAK